MGLDVKFQPMDRSVVFDLAGLLDPKEQSAALAEYARQEIAEVERQNEAAIGRPVTHETVVDGVHDAPLERVKPDGVIVAIFDLGSDLISFVFDQVKAHAPVLTGKFRRSIILFADGVPYDSAADVPPDADEIVITSNAPYARKLEGLAGKKHMSHQAPNGVFEAVAAVAKSRYGNQAKITFTMRSPIGGNSALEGWARNNAARRDGRVQQRRQYQKNTRQPAITIVFR